MSFLKTPRERGMAILLGSAVGLTATVSLAERFVLEPLARKRTEIASLKTKAADLDFEAALVRRGQARLAEESAQGLPADPITATLAYQHWLLEATRRCGFQEVHISPGRAIPEEHVGHRLPFTISCRGRFVALVNFLELVRTTPALHRLSQVSVTPDGSAVLAAHDDKRPKAEELGLSITLEALALQGGPETATLTVPGSVPMEHRLTRLKQLASGGNLFARPVAERARGSTKPPLLAGTKATEAEKPQPTGTTLIACGARNQVAEAWFHRPPEEEPLRVQLQQTFVLEGQTVRLAEIHPDAVVLASAGGRRRIALGERIEAEQAVD